MKEEEDEAPSPLDQLADEMDDEIREEVEQREPLSDQAPSDVCDVRDLRVFSLFDGHGGSACAKRAAQLMNRFLIRKLLDLKTEPTSANMRDTLERLFVDFHNEHCRTLRSGSTASVVVLCRRIVAAACVGDSRVVLFRLDGGKAQPLWASAQHNTDNDDERRRLQQEGVKLEQLEPGDILRFHTGLSVTRTLGDSDTKEVTRVPELYLHERSADERLVLVMATDGLWDVVTTEQVGELLEDRCSSVAEFMKVAPLLCRQAYDDGSEDNISVQAIALGLFTK